MATPNPIRDPILERPLPSSPDSERAILGSIVLDNSLIAQAVELLDPDDFYVPSNRRIFKAMIFLFQHSSEITPILIAENLKRDNSLESVGGVIFLTNLTYGLPHVNSIVQYAKVVRGKSLLRKLVKVASKITSEALEEEDEPQDILDHAEHAILALTLAQHAAIESKAVVGIFSLEMSAESLAMRMLCSEASVDAQKFRSG